MVRRLEFHKLISCSNLSFPILIDVVWCQKFEIGISFISIIISITSSISNKFITYTLHNMTCFIHHHHHELCKGSSIWIIITDSIMVSILGYFYQRPIPSVSPEIGRFFMQIGKQKNTFFWRKLMLIV